MIWWMEHTGTLEVSFVIHYKKLIKNCFLVYLILGEYHEHIGLMWSLYSRGLFNDGN